MEKRLEGILEIASAILIAAAVIYFSDSILSLGAYGYGGAFLISLLSSATIIFPAPGWAAIVALSRTLDPVYLGIVAGIGSAIGELTGYLAGDGVRDLINNRIKETKSIEDVVRKYGAAGIFVFAFLPNPLFDVAGIVAGGLKLPWWQYLAACAAGRVIRYVLLAMIGAFSLSFI